MIAPPCAPSVLFSRHLSSLAVLLTSNSFSSASLVSGGVAASYDSTSPYLGDRVDFSAVTSERIRVGARVSHALTDKIRPYAGTAFEHKFGGKARASVNGISLDVPSMAGSTGILEAGLTLTPSADLPLSVDLGIEGFVGQREGIAGSQRAGA